MDSSNVKYLWGVFVKWTNQWLDVYMGALNAWYVNKKQTSFEESLHFSVHV